MRTFTNYLVPILVCVTTLLMIQEHQTGVLVIAFTLFGIYFATQLLLGGINELVQAKQEQKAATQLGRFANIRNR